MDIEQEYDLLLRYCYMRLRDKTLAEDITQESFIRFFESHEYRNRGKEMAYLYTIARNLCIDHFRKHKDGLLDDMPDQVQQLPESEDRIQSVVDRVSIEQAMNLLGEDEREIVLLRYSMELPVSDIAIITGNSRFVVRRRIRSALEKLKKEMTVDE